MTRDRQFLNVVEEPIFGEKIRRNVRNGIFSTKLAGQDGKREKGRGCSGNLFSHFPFSTFVASSTFRLHPSRFLSPVFPQKNRFACPPLHHARQHRREHAPARNRNHRFFFSEQFHLSCIRILLLFLFFSSVSSTCFLCLFHFFLRFSLFLRFHHCVTFLLHFTRHENLTLAFLPMAFPRKTRRYDATWVCDKGVRKLRNVHKSPGIFGTNEYRDGYI